MQHENSDKIVSFTPFTPSPFTPEVKLTPKMTSAPEKNVENDMQHETLD